MNTYFGLQYKMITRGFKEAGLHPLLACIILTIGFVGLSFYLFSKTELATYIYLLSALSLTARLSESRRSEFLQLCFGDKRLRQIRITENLVCAFPFLVFLLCKQLFMFAGLLLILAVVLALVNFRASLNFTIPTPFSKKPFEFPTGFRNTFHLIIAAYALTIIAVSVRNFNLGAFAMMLVFATTLSYYAKPENEYYVWIYKQNARAFLFGKIKTAILFSSALVLPIALSLAIFFPENIAILLLFILIGWAFVTCMIVSKYSAYPEEMNIPQGILLALSIVFPPLLLVLIPYLFIKSENRLSSFLR